MVPARGIRCGEFDPACFLAPVRESCAVQEKKVEMGPGTRLGGSTLNAVLDVPIGTGWLAVISLERGVWPRIIRRTACKPVRQREEGREPIPRSFRSKD